MALSVGPPCGPVNCNEKIVTLLQRLKPEIKDVIEQLNLVSSSTSTPGFRSNSLCFLGPYQLGHGTCQVSAGEGSAS